jgi:hypothetical protein
MFALSRLPSLQCPPTGIVPAVPTTRGQPRTLARGVTQSNRAHGSHKPGEASAAKGEVSPP